MTTPAQSSEAPTNRGGLRGLPRNVWALTLTSLFTDISSDMIVNLIPLFLANVLGAKTGVIGLIEGIAESTASLLKVFSGWLSDRIGKRKGLTVAGYSISTIAKPFLYFAGSWWWVLIVRFADRVGKGVRTAPRDALVAGSVDEENRGLAFGLHRAGDTAGAMIGMLIALGVVWATQAGSLTLGRVTFQRLVLLSIIPAVLAVLVLAFGAREVPVKEGETSEPLRLSLRGFDRRFRYFTMVIFLFTLGNSADAFLILRAQERGLNVVGTLGMLATFNLIYAAISGPAGALSDRIGRRKLIIGGWLAYGLLYLGFAFSSTAWQIWLLYGLYGIYYGVVEGVAKAYVADIVSPQQRGTAYGIYNAVIGIAALPASLIAGLLWQGAGGWQGFGPQAPFLFGAALALVAVVLFVVEPFLAGKMARR
ncbi:MAG: MFS transporter [Anaerolineae bacterium]|nr:MFS transporter [Anaerolineae bacterium]